MGQTVESEKVDSHRRTEGDSFILRLNIYVCLCVWQNSKVKLVKALTNTKFNVITSTGEKKANDALGTLQRYLSGKYMRICFIIICRNKQRNKHVNKPSKVWKVIYQLLVVVN